MPKPLHPITYLDTDVTAVFPKNWSGAAFAKDTNIPRKKGASL